MDVGVFVIVAVWGGVWIVCGICCAVYTFRLQSGTFWILGRFREHRDIQIQARRSRTPRELDPELEPLRPHNADDIVPTPHGAVLRVPSSV